MNETKKKTRRRYGAELKQQILAQCAEPDASVARIALSHGINANVVHKWRRQGGSALPAPYPSGKVILSPSGIPRMLVSA
jgi:transposase